MGLVDRERIKLITLQKKIGPALEQVDEEFRRITDGDSPLTIEICDHIRRGKSKRFRPTLLLLAAQSDESAEIPPGAITAAASVELVHTATLVHDDFIDEAVTRRGLPSVNEKWGGDAALIMGDYIYAISDRGVTAHLLSDLTPTASVQLQGTGQDYCYYY